MSNELESLARGLAEGIGGKGAGINIDGLARILASDSGKRVVASLLADGGENVKHAAQSAQNGDMSGVQNIISQIGSTPDGAKLLSEIISASGR